MNRRRLLALIMILGISGVSAPALALTLDEARARGWVGEKPDGYVALVRPDAPEEAKALVERVNAERRRIYEELARKQGVSVEVVAAITARKIIERLPSGTYVMDAEGRWVRKP